VDSLRTSIWKRSVGWDGFAQGSGNFKFDVRFDPGDKLVRFYSLGSVKEDGSPSSEELGTAVLLGEARLKVRARLPNAYNVLDLDTIFAKNASDK